MTTSAARPLTVPTPDGPMPAQLWLPESGSGPGLVMVQEIFGVSPYIQRRCADLAGLGYVVLAPELYWRLEDRTVDETRSDVLQQAMALAAQTDWDQAVGDVRSALVALQARPEVAGGAGLFGFCYGGGLAFHAAALTDPTVLVSYYGSALPELVTMADDVTAPSLHHFGLSDTFIPAPEVERIQGILTKGSNVTFHTYADAGHAFDNFTMDVFYHGGASTAAWENTVTFLSRELQVF
jgi:carboxymethylenebutenolidase